MIIDRFSVGEIVGAYTTVVVARGPTAFLSGHGPFVDGEIVGDSIADQTRTTLSNFAATLRALTLSPDSVIRCGCYLADMNDFAAFDEEYKSFFGATFPARTTI